MDKRQNNDEILALSSIICATVKLKLSHDAGVVGSNFTEAHLYSE